MKWICGQSAEGIRSASCLMALCLLLLACADRPSAVEQRKTEIRRQDSLELAQTRADLAVADSVATFKAFELEDLKKQWVLPSYKGSKERFSFYPEVEEGGKLLLVSIDKQRQYSFTDVDLMAEDYTALLPKGLSDAQKKDVAKCYALAKAMHDLQETQKQQEKLRLKERFYTEKQLRLPR